MKMRIASVLGCAALLLLSACGGASETSQREENTEIPNYVWRCAAMAPEDSPTVLGLQEFARLLNAKSDGRIQLTCFSNDDLGAEEDFVLDLQQNTLEFALCSPSTLSAYTDSQNVWELPYLFDSRETARSVLDSAVGKACLSDLEEIHLKGLAYFEGGMFVMDSSSLIGSAADVAGKSVLLHGTPLSEDVYAAWGAALVRASSDDGYESL